MPIEIKDAAQFQWMWNHNGQVPGGAEGERIGLKDAFAVPNAHMLFPKVISNIVKEAQEPLLVGTSLLTRINYSFGQSITFPAVGAMEAADLGETEEYPEKTLEMGGATVTANIGKVGLAVAVTEEMVRFSQFDVIGMHLRAAGRALARHKEQKIFNYIRMMGVTAFDNINPTNSLFGVCTGRDLEGNANGAATADNIFDCFAQVLTQGFMANTLLMHPLTWTMFVKDAQLRAFVQTNGGGTFFASWTGNPAGQAPWANSSQGGLGISPGQNIDPATAPLSAYPQTLNSAPQLPSYLNVPFRIIVSPYVPMDPRRKLTDIYMFDSNELGVLVVDHDVMTDEFEDPSRDIRKIKLKERYGIGILNEGQGIAVMRNVKIVPNEVVLPAQVSIDASGLIQKIDPSTPLDV